jgi:hypothetical protein
MNMEIRTQFSYGRGFPSEHVHRIKNQHYIRTTHLYGFPTEMDSQFGSRTHSCYGRQLYMAYPSFLLSRLPHPF